MACEEIKKEGYSFHLVNISCIPTSENFNIVMDLDESIEEVLPYLAAHLTTCTYVHGAGVLNLMDSGHIVAMYPRQITITDVSDETEAARLCQTYFDIILEVKSKRHIIEPVFDKRPSLTVLDIFRRLPRTNCGLCGSPTCLAFAAKIFRHEDLIGSCPPLAKELEVQDPFSAQLLLDGYKIR